MRPYSCHDQLSELRPRVRVLYVEDELDHACPLMRQLTASTLAVFEIAHRANVKSALMELEHETFDVLLADLSLPDADGSETVVSMAALARHLPVVFLTAHDDEDLRDYSIRAGAQKYLVKQRSSANTVAREILEALDLHRRSVAPDLIRANA